MKEIVKLIKQVIALHNDFEAGFKSLPEADSLRHMISMDNFEERRLGHLSVERGKMDVLLRSEPYRLLIQSAQAIERKHQALLKKEAAFSAALQTHCSVAAKALKKELKVKMNVHRIEDVAKKPGWNKDYLKVDGLIGKYREALIRLEGRLVEEERNKQLAPSSDYERILEELGVIKKNLKSNLPLLDAITKELLPIKKMIVAFLEVDAIKIKQEFLNTLKTNVWPMVRATSVMRALRDIVDSADKILHGDSLLHMAGFALGERKATLELASLEFKPAVTPYIALLEDLEVLHKKLKGNVNDPHFLEKYQEDIDRSIVSSAFFKDQQQAAENFYLTHKKTYVLMFQAAQADLVQFEKEVHQQQVAGANILKSLQVFREKIIARMAVSKRREVFKQEVECFEYGNADQAVKHELFNAFKEVFLRTGSSGYLLVKLSKHGEENLVPQKQTRVAALISQLNDAANLQDLRQALIKAKQDNQLIFRSSSVGGALRLPSKSSKYVDKLYQRLNLILQVKGPYASVVKSSIDAAIRQAQEDVLTCIPSYNFDQVYNDFKRQFLSVTDVESNPDLATLNREIIALRHWGGDEEAKFIRMALIVEEARNKLVNNLSLKEKMDEFITNNLTLNEGVTLSHPFSYHYQQLRRQIEESGTARPIREFLTKLNVLAKDQTLTEHKKWEAMRTIVIEFYCEVRASRNGNEALLLRGLFGRGSRLADKLESFLRDNCQLKDLTVPHRVNNKLKAMYALTMSR